MVPAQSYQSERASLGHFSSAALSNLKYKKLLNRKGISYISVKCACMLETSEHRWDLQLDPAGRMFKSYWKEAIYWSV
jgi:hypothetical protein